MVKKEESTQIKIVGDMTWREFKHRITQRLINANSEEETVDVIKALVVGMGTVETIQEARRRMGVKPLTDEELKEINEQ